MGINGRKLTSDINKFAFNFLFNKLLNLNFQPNIEFCFYMNFK